MTLRLPAGLGELRRGEFVSEPVRTSAGTVVVGARGFVLDARWGGVYRLRPVDVVVTRPDGRRETVEVIDPTRRTLRALRGAGIVVALISILIERGLGRR